MVHESGEETSHPDIDSALEIHIKSGDFSYKTRIVDGTTEHLIMKFKSNQWTVHFQIEDDDVKTLDKEELVTFLIHQIQTNRKIRRQYHGMIVLAFAVGIPVILFSVLVLRIQGTDDFEIFLIAGGVTVAMIPVLCFLMSSAERSVDADVYAIRPNLVDVFKKQMDLKEYPFEKVALEKRIERLTEPQ
ncbi:MAG: hypothetical protein ACFFE2_14615 [Candidatus Thorarchaeota archaeon]